MKDIGLWLSVIGTVVFATSLMYVKTTYFKVLPGEEGLDLRSFIFAKASHLVLPKKSTVEVEIASIGKSRMIYNGFLKLCQYWDYFRDPELSMITFEELTIPVPASYNGSSSEAAEIPIRVYNFDRDEEMPMKPVLLWFHGGGWSKGSMDGDHTQCLKIGKELGMVVVNVDYRMAPEYRYPYAPKDAIESLSWVIDNIESFRGDPTQIVVGGESAGGNLAAIVVSDYLLKNPEKKSPFFGLYLIYPALDIAIDPVGPGLEFANTNGLLTLAGTARSRWIYSGSPDLSLRRTYMFAPILTSDEVLSKYPPTVFVVAKYDVLAHESHEYAAKLQSHDIPVALLEYETTIHGFFGREIISPYGPIALQESTAALLDLLKI